MQLSQHFTFIMLYVGSAVFMASVVIIATRLQMSDHQESLSDSFYSERNKYPRQPRN